MNATDSPSSGTSGSGVGRWIALAILAAVVFVYVMMVTARTSRGAAPKVRGSVARFPTCSCNRSPARRRPWRRTISRARHAVELLGNLVPALRGRVSAPSRSWPKRSRRTRSSVSTLCRAVAGEAIPSSTNCAAKPKRFCNRTIPRWRPTPIRRAPRGGPSWPFQGSNSLRTLPRWSSTARARFAVCG